MTATLGTVTGYTATGTAPTTVIADTSLTPAAGAVNATLTAGGTVAASTSADIFKLAGGTTAGYTTTITGFNYLADKIQVPVGQTFPSAVAGGVNDVADGQVSLTWSNNSQAVTILLTGVDAVTETAMQANAVNAMVYGTY